MSRLDFISLNVRGYSTLLSLPLADLNVYKQKTPLIAGLDGIIKFYFTSNAHRNPCTSWNHFTSGGLPPRLYTRSPLCQLYQWPPRETFSLPVSGPFGLSPLETPYNSHAGTSPGTTLPHCLPCRTIHIYWVQNCPPALYYISIYLSHYFSHYDFGHIHHHPSNIYGNWHRSL